MRRPGRNTSRIFSGPRARLRCCKRRPATPVADALTKAVGPDKAKQMIDANPSILNGQLSGSVKQWADTKMGGAVPGGGSIYDMLRPDVREEVLAHAEAAQQKQQVANRIDFGMRVNNATAEALDTGQPSHPLALSDFIGEYGAANGPAEYAKYDTQVQTGRAIQGMATMTPPERDATVSSLAPQPGDANYALKAHAFEVAQQARAHLELTASKDPAGFAASSLPASKEAYQAFAQALTNPAAAPGDRATAAQTFAGRTLVEQNRFGILEDAQRVAPEGYIDGLNKTISAAATSDDAGKRVSLIGQIQQEASMWGQYWPQVMRQLAPGSQPIVRAIAAGADPTAMTRLLSLDPKQEKPAELLKQQSETKAGDLTKQTDTAMAPFFSTLVGRQRDRDFTGYYNLATQLGALYVRDGMSASDAAGKAFNDLVGKNYDFRDSYRIPKSSGVAPDDVQAGAQAARAIITNDGRAPISINSSFEQAKTDLNLNPQEQALYQRHLTNLTGAGGVDNPDGSRSSLFQSSVEVEGKTYNIPTVWDGKILKPADALARAKQEGIDKFPSYGSEDEAEARYGQMHDYMEKDTGQFLAARKASAFNIQPAVDDVGLGADNRADSLTKFGRDGKWVTAPDQSGLNLAYGDKFVRTNDGAPLKLSWDQLGKLGATSRADVQRETDTAPRLLGVLGTSLQGPMTLTANMGRRANWEKFQAEARPSTNVEDDRNRPKSFKEKYDNTIDQATDQVATGLFE